MVPRLRFRPPSATSRAGAHATQRCGQCVVATCIIGSEGDGAEEEAEKEEEEEEEEADGTAQMQGLTLVHFPAQLEPCLSQQTPHTS